MSGFLHELKRRKVIRVALAYLVAAWVLMQVADVMSPVLELPDWAPKLVFYLLLIGFVPALILAWAFELTPSGIKRELDETGIDQTPEVRGARIERVIIGVLGVVLLTAGGLWYAGKDARWARTEAYPLIEQYATAGDWEAAYAVAKSVAARIPNDPELTELWPTFTWLTSIPSRPSGATVYRRPYADADAEWEFLGKTPLSNIHVPLGMSVLRIELEDRVPLLRVIGGETNGSRVLTITEDPTDSAGQLHPWVFEIETPEVIPDGMVRVPGAVREVNGQSIELRDFFIDRFEVSNRQFKVFVDSGSYQKRELWEHEFVLNGETVSWEQAMSEFVDSSGRPGPATWEAGSYPDGKESHPVTGVSWYEAAAYARFVRRELPTFHHWRRAFAEVLLSWLLPRSNLDATDTAPVGQFPGLGWTGTYDMAGNVREWCLNAVDDQRVILGGSWNDPPYITQESVTDPGSLPPFDRSSTNGFRLAATNDDRRVADLLREPVVIEEEVLVGEVVSDEVFAAFLNNFEYDAGPLDPIVDETVSSLHWTRQRITLRTTFSEERLSIYLYLPNTNSARYQTVVFWPTILALMLESVDDLSMPLDFVLKNGRAVMVPVLDGTLERRLPAFPDWASIAGRDLVIRQVKDMRRAIDYLETRADIDADALAYYGYSWGGRMGPIALVADDRLQTGILNQAGLQHLAFPETSVLNYLPRVDVPVLQFNGRYDSDFRFETAAKPFFDLLGTRPEDKKHMVAPTGHFVPRATVVGETLDWLDKYLGPPSP